MSAVHERSASLRLAADLEPTAHVTAGLTEYRVEVEVPGLDERDLRVELAGRTVRVTGPDLRTATPEATFEFLFRLPDTADAGGLEAIFADGVLSLRAPAAAGPVRAVPVTPRP